MDKLYDRIDWVNDTTPALNEDNLNAMSKGLDDIDNRVVALAGDVLVVVPQIQAYLEQAQDLVEALETLSQNPPYIGQNGNWYVWDTNTSQFVDSGIDASITVTIADVTAIAPEASPYVTNTGTNTDPIFHLFIPRGQTGQTGNGIASIAKTGTSGNVDTYTITMTDGSTATFTVTNGTGSTFAELGDVSLSNLQNGDVPKWNSTTQKWENGAGGSASIDADDVTYDNTSSGLTATNVQDAIDELASADNISYDNTTSGLTATDVQDAIDEVEDRVDDVETALAKVKWSNAVSKLIGDTSCTITDAAIATTSVVEPFSDNVSGTPMSYTSITVTTGQVVLAFDALTEDTDFKVRITN